MRSWNRVHLYPHAGPETTGYIVGDPQGLRDLAKKLLLAADGMVGIENMTMFGSDGHPYDLLIVCDVSEPEWQAMPLPQARDSDPSQLEIVKAYQELKSGESKGREPAPHAV